MRRHLVRTLLLAALVPALLVSGAVQAKPKASGKKAATSSVPAANNKKKPADIKLKPDETQDIGEQQQAQTNSPPPSRGPTRIDFDDRLVQGQTNKSGAVYLYDRKELKTRSMIKKRE